VKVLIIGFACSPRLGGEPSNAWNWAWELSRYHQVWVLAHPHDRNGIEEFLTAHPNPTLSTEWVGFPKMLDDPRLRRSNLVLAIHYQMWLRVAYKKQSNFTGRWVLTLFITSALGRSTYPLRLGSCLFLCLGAGWRSSASAFCIPSLHLFHGGPRNPS